MSNKQTTAMQELIEIIDFDYSEGENTGIDSIRRQATELLAKEREIIVQTFNHGWNNGNLDADMTGSKYFTQNFKQD